MQLDTHYGEKEILQKIPMRCKETLILSYDTRICVHVLYFFSVHNMHNDELSDLYSSPIIIRMIKSKSMRWAGHVARMREKRNAYRLLVEKPVRERDY
jgi:hypothetical protein